MKARWHLLLIAPVAVSLGLLLASQAVFLQASLYADLGFGRVSERTDLGNYIKIAIDPFYLFVLWLSVQVSAAAAAATIVLGFPVAFILSRLDPRFAFPLLATIVMTSFVTIVIKIFGLVVIFQADGPLNRALLALGAIAQPFSPIGTPGGVVLGLFYFSVGFAVMLLYAVVRTIPVSLEEAAAIHGARRHRVMLRVILPLALPGLIVSFLTVFNLCMGAFTSAALLGAGKVLTLPVLIQRTLLMDVKYGMAGALSALLLVSVLLINLASIAVLRRFRAARMSIA
jgi:putative spermidine/putrescine transport system permease protein